MIDQGGPARLEQLLPADGLAALAAKAESADRLQLLFDLLSSALGQAGYEASARAFVTELATRMHCDRVSLGTVSNGRVTIMALSHSSTFSPKTTLVRAITAAMEEALDQRHTIVLPPLPTTTTKIRRAHDELIREFHSATVCSVPLLSDGRVTGLLTLERGAEQPFDRSALDVLEALSAVTGPLFEMQRRDARWLGGKVWEAVRSQCAKLTGPRHVGFKLATLGVAALVAFVCLATGDYRVTAKTVLEGSIQQAAAVPFHSFLETAPVRAGDVVQAGQVLATLQEHDLKLERLRWQSQRDQLAKEYRQVLADRDAAKVEIKAAELAQAEAQLALASEKLARVRITAPFAGVVVSGDWSQRLGSPLEEGQVLFEVAPLHDYRVVLQVDDRDMAGLRAGQSGTLLLSSLPHDELPFTVTQLTPVSIAKDGRNYFRVEARLTVPPSDRLRPAMEGVGKIAVEERSLVWIWTHDIVDWAYLKLWAWLP
ncbi:MAG: HlyD family efflux transporter periplasmic adaptor subunit [Nitrospira sp. CR2.1]|nr:HlyD family efflux transporter periplasmic adaptor subunit [Nitrospira sp. CR2.1]